MFKIKKEIKVRKKVAVSLMRKELKEKYMQKSIEVLQLGDINV